MKSKLYTMLKENTLLKNEMERLLNLIKENEAKNRGFQLVEDAFLMSDSVEDIEVRALLYLEEIFDVDKAMLFVDKNHYRLDNLNESLTRIKYTDERTLKYAFVEKRPFFNKYPEGLLSDFHALDNTSSYLMVPIIENNKITASLNLYSVKSEKFSGEFSTDFVEKLATRIAITLQKLHNVQTILYFAQYDFLTNVYNKAMMNVLLQKYADRYKLTNTPFTFALLDMDNFKALNETHGHIVGDETLREVVSGIKDLLGDRGVLGRFGGDEFYMLLDLATPVDVKEVFSHIVSTVDEIAKKYDMFGKLGISGGFVCVPLDMDVPDVDILDIVKMADVGLFHSKASGKRICSAYMGE